VNEYQLLFRGADGAADQTEFRFNEVDGHPKIDGRLIVDGDTYAIRGSDWLLRKDDSATEMERFVCTLVVEPVDE
jgi:hypothetical protein